MTMYNFPGFEPGLNIMGIDPGSTEIGVTVIGINPATRQVNQTVVWTIEVDRLHDRNSIVVSMHGDRFARLQALQQTMTQVFAHYQPAAIGCEAPFYNRRTPGAYGPLVETVMVIRQALNAYYPYLGLDMVAPMDVKQCIGARSVSRKKCPKVNGLKPEVVEAMISTVGPFLKLTPEQISRMNEHEMDSAAIAYWRLQSLFRGA